jgi:hypothetical protein
VARSSLGSAPLTVACVLRRGGLYWGSREGAYFAKYVRILRDSVAQHLSLPHRFVCLTDVAVPCARIDLHEFWPGGWAKLELFKRGLFDGPVLYFDLATVVLGELDELARVALDGEFGAVRHRQGGLDDAVMAWRVDCSFIHRRHAWLPEYFRYRHRAAGHRGFIEAALGRAAITWHAIDAALPGAVIDYADLGVGGVIPSPVRLCLFHGRPRPHELEVEQFAHWDRARLD